MPQWYLYVLQCNDNTLYAGITTEPSRRLNEHNDGPLGAKYTRSRRPVALLATWPHPDRKSASKAEYAFKRMTRQQKLKMVQARLLEEAPSNTC